MTVSQGIGIDVLWVFKRRFIADNYHVACNWSNILFFKSIKMHQICVSLAQNQHSTKNHPPHNVLDCLKKQMRGVHLEPCRYDKPLRAEVISSAIRRRSNGLDDFGWSLIFWRQSLSIHRYPQMMSFNMAWHSPPLTSRGFDTSRFGV